MGAECIYWCRYTCMNIVIYAWPWSHLDLISCSVARRAWHIGIAFLEFDQFQLIYFCSSFLGYGISELFGIYVEVDEFFQSTASVIWQGLPILRYMRFWCRTKWREVVTPRDVLRNNFNSFSRTFFIFGGGMESADLYKIVFFGENKLTFNAWNTT